MPLPSMDVKEDLFHQYKALNQLIAAMDCIADQEMSFPNFAFMQLQNGKSEIPSKQEQQLEAIHEPKRDSSSSPSPVYIVPVYSLMFLVEFN